jgi:hypothetical protein
LPTEFPDLAYVSGPADKSLLGKGAWRKPVILKHEESGVMVRVNCFRRREKPDAKDAKVPGTPFLRLREPDYQYKQFEFHELSAATATAEDRQVIVFRSGEVLFKVEATGGKAEDRKKLQQMPPRRSGVLSRRSSHAIHKRNNSMTDHSKTKLATDMNS